MITTISFKMVRDTKMREVAKLMTYQRQDFIGLVDVSLLPHFGLVTPYSGIVFGLYWFK